MTSTKIT